MTFDLTNLEGVFATGKLMEAGAKGRAYLTTPVCRFSYPRLVEAKATTRNTRLTWGVTPIFEAGQGVAHVDLKPVLVKAILGVAQDNENPLRKPPQGGAAQAAFNQWAKDFGSPAVAYCIWREWLRPGDEAEKTKEDGSFVAGYGPGKIFFSCNQYANEDASNAPEIRDGSGSIIKPGLVKPGYYGRLGLDLYWNAANSRVCFGLRAVQLLAKGEELGGGGFDFSTEFGSVEGAEDFSGSSITDAQMWDAEGTGNDGLPF